MLRKIKNNIFLILILGIGVFLAAKNYTPNTFLSGWDTLHPEFDFGLAFKREINGVFRTEQGLGAVAAHSHMADLPRVFILYILHFLFPTDILRYLYIFLNLILGPIGIYLLLNKYIVKNKISSFLGSLFYLLNPGTMQQFIVPFEMFTTQYALLPWLFLFTTDYLSAKEKQVFKLFLFSLTTLFAAPMAYAATLWYMYFLAFLLYLFSLNIFARSLLFVKKSAFLIVLTLLINSFWILPNIYFVLNHGSVVANSLINQFFSPEAFLYNKEFGNIKDIVLLRSFLFDWNVFSGKDFVLLLSPWINHLNQKPVLVIGFLFAVMMFFGIWHAVVRKNKILISFLPILFLCLFFLINDNFPTSFLYNFVQNKIPLFQEAFRFPDNKVFGIFTFLFTVFFTVGLNTILKFKKSLKLILLPIFSFLIIYYSLPAFSGNLISPYMRINIPKDYFEMFEWFKNQKDNARVASLPIQSIFGWQYYDWGFQGADFLQFGIKQPLLIRDFDRWNMANEQYYREMSNAIYSQDLKKLENVLKKYDISYILFDKSIIAPEQKMSSQVLFLKETENLLANSQNLKKVFDLGSLSVYSVESPNQKIRVLKNPVSIGPSPSIFYEDFAYAKYNDYITYSDSKRNTVFYPFRNITDNKNRILPGVVFPSFPNQEKQYIVFPWANSANDCATQSNSKSEIKTMEEESEMFLRYFSSSDTVCNHYSLPSIQRGQTYLISIVSRNISGLPLKFCITNYISKRCDLFTMLSSSSAFQEESFFLPEMGKGIGFDINFSNFAVKKTPSINDLKSIKITPILYGEFQKIEQYNPNGNSQNNDSLFFSQSFEKGWLAYEIKLKTQKSKFKTFLATNFPFLFGKEIKEHVLVNNWANGWIIDNEKLQVKSYKLIVIFWPQYLEYLGFALLTGTFVVLLWTIVKPYISPNSLSNS